jgi:hypothetical protein
MIGPIGSGRCCALGRARSQVARCRIERRHCAATRPIDQAHRTISPTAAGGRPHRTASLVSERIPHATDAQAGAGGLFGPRQFRGLIILRQFPQPLAASSKPSPARLYAKSLLGPSERLCQGDGLPLTKQSCHSGACLEFGDTAGLFSQRCSQKHHDVRFLGAHQTQYSARCVRSSALAGGTWRFCLPRPERRKTHEERGRDFYVRARGRA